MERLEDVLRTSEPLGSIAVMLRGGVDSAAKIVRQACGRWWAAASMASRSRAPTTTTTKWLAKHRPLVMAALNLAGGSSSEPDDLSQSELDPLGLRALPSSVSLILADPNDQQRHGGLRQMQAPAPEIAGLRLKPRHVLIAENKESALIVPDAPGLVVIHSLGNNLEPLSGLSWLGKAECWYWGDLDRAGMTLLSRARVKIPRIRSLLMDSATLDTHEWLAVQEQDKADRPADNLDEDEQVVAARLWDGNGSYLRLEQERISPTWALNAISRAVHVAGLEDVD